MGIAIFLIYCVYCQSISLATSLNGTVLDENGPIPGATVRAQTTTMVAHTDSAGSFSLNGLTPCEAVSVSAWGPGYYIGGGEEWYPGAEITLLLKPIPFQDNHDYVWVSAFSTAGVEGNCQNCHSALNLNDTEGSLPFDQWQQDPHANSAHNIRFLTMYSGTDIDGHQSPLTLYSSIPEYGRFPLPPDPQKPYYGPGYKIDFPTSAGNCAACHTPAASVRTPYGTDPRKLQGVEAEGLTCDFCHKVWAVRINPKTGTPYPNMPGVLSMEFRRPIEGHQLFIGPLDDVAPGEDTFNPLYSQSRYCAPCHFGDFWNVRIYNSFGEWLESPYSDQEQAVKAGLDSARTCQDCHMPQGLNDHFVRLEKQGRLRDPKTIHSHNMTVTQELLRSSLNLDVETEIVTGEIQVMVTVTNTGAGHHVPTDSPLRQVILLVEATDTHGNPLKFVEGPELPPWTGPIAKDISKINDDFYGIAGRLFAKTLQEIWTEVVPTGAYWKPTRIVEDTRIPALGHDMSTYTFSTDSTHGPYTITVTLLYRRAFSELSIQKGWNIRNIVMAQKKQTIEE